MHSFNRQATRDGGDGSNVFLYIFLHISRASHRKGNKTHR